MYNVAYELSTSSRSRHREEGKGKIKKRSGRIVNWGTSPRATPPIRANWPIPDGIAETGSAMRAF